MKMSLIDKFTRRKFIDKNVTETQLHRVLSTLDLTLLGIGSTLGLGIYVIAGSVAKNDAGPAVVISFLVAAFASVLAGLCYAEFGARVPKAGSAYVYSYVCVGEIIAFIVGWNLIMEYVIGVASVARGYSGYVDSLVSEQMSSFFKEITPMNVPHLSPYVDFFALAITLALTLILAFGVKESSFFNNIFTILNLVVVLFVIIAGAIYAKAEYWALKPEDIDELFVNSTIPHNFTQAQIGQGGFAPFGFHGIMKGAATCFYGFVGFDCIATTGEEAKNPQRSIPLAIIFSLLFIFLAYFGISTVLTMMVPYFLQDAVAPLPHAFMSVGFTTGKWFVTIGALFGLSTSLLGAMFPMPRVIYAMATDGVLFKFLATVHPRFQTPLIATLIAGSFGGLMAALFELDALIDMMSIGTLTAYTLVAICVLCLRYRKDADGADDTGNATDEPLTFRIFKSQLFNSSGLLVPNSMSSSFTNLIVVIYCVVTCFFCAVAIFLEEEIQNLNILAILLLSIFGVSMCICLISLACQPVSRVQLTFKVPFVPIIPGFSVLANVYLILKLSGATWVRFAVWMLIGFVFYGYCLLSGTTDASYEAQLGDNNKRKYSKVSVTALGPINKLSSPTVTNEKQDYKKPETNSKGNSNNGNLHPGLLNGSKSENGTKQLPLENGNHGLNKDKAIETEKLQCTASEDVELKMLGKHSKETHENDEASIVAEECIDSVLTAAHIHSVAQKCLNNEDPGDLKPLLLTADEKKEIQEQNAKLQIALAELPKQVQENPKILMHRDLAAKVLEIHTNAQAVLRNGNGNQSEIVPVNSLETVLQESDKDDLITSPVEVVETVNHVLHEIPLPPDHVPYEDMLGYESRTPAYKSNDKMQNNELERMLNKSSFVENLVQNTLKLREEDKEVLRGENPHFDILTEEPIHSALRPVETVSPLNKEPILVEIDGEQDLSKVDLREENKIMSTPESSMKLKEIEDDVNEVDSAFSDVLQSNSEEDISSSASSIEKDHDEAVSVEASSKSSAISAKVELLVTKPTNEQKM